LSNFASFPENPFWFSVTATAGQPLLSFHIIGQTNSSFLTPLAPLLKEPIPLLTAQNIQQLQIAIRTKFQLSDKFHRTQIQTLERGKWKTHTGKKYNRLF